MIRVDPTLLFIQAVTFGLAVLVLWRFFWKPLTRFMERRQRGIEQDIETAREGRAAAEKLEEQYQQQIADIDARAAALLELASNEGRKRQKEILDQAQAEAKRLLENANRQIAEEKTRALRELRGEAVALAMLIAERAMKQSVDAKMQGRLVDEFVRDLKNG